MNFYTPKKEKSPNKPTGGDRLRLPSDTRNRSDWPLGTTVTDKVGGSVGSILNPEKKDKRNGSDWL